MKQFFQKFPFLQYDPNGSGNQVTACDLIQRAKVRDVFANNYLIFYEHTVRDGETPEIIAHKLYGSAQYHWIVLLINNIIDPYYDWPMSTESLNATIRKKYGTPTRDGLEYALSTVHHLEDINGNTIDEATFVTLAVIQRRAVTIYEWEVDQNEAKRKIRLLDKRYVDQINAELDSIMSQNPLS